jgi:hypothetical protein
VGWPHLITTYGLLGRRADQYVKGIDDKLSAMKTADQFHVEKLEFLDRDAMARFVPAIDVFNRAFRG